MEESLGKQPTFDEVLDHARKLAKLRETGQLCCNFCARRQDEVPALMAGPNVYICSQCVELCVDMLRENHPEFCVPVKTLDEPGLPKENT